MVARGDDALYWRQKGDLRLRPANLGSLPEAALRRRGPHCLTLPRAARLESSCLHLPRAGISGSWLLWSTHPAAAMVHAFLIHTLRAPNLEDTGLCRVLYSCVFGAEKSSDDSRQHGAERDRLFRKEQILAVARQVESLCRLQQQASGCPSTDLQPPFSDEPVSLHEAPHGAFHLVAGDPFQEPQTVVWLGVFSIGFALVLDTHENLLLAESTLRLLARLLLDHLRLLTPGTNFLLRADRIEGILARFLPHGQLLFLNDQFVQDLEKEFSAAWPR